MGVKGKARGTRQKVLEMLLADIEVDLPRVDRRRIFVTHFGCDQDADLLVKKIERIGKPDEVRVTLAGSVISDHSGPGTIGILYFFK